MSRTEHIGDPTAERLILGTVIANGSRLSEVAGRIVREDFSTEANRRVFSRMLALQERGEEINRVSVASELMRVGELESVGGMSALIDLDNDMPQLASVASFVRIVKDKSALRTIAHTAQHLLNRALLAEESPDELLAEAEDGLLKIGESRQVGSDGLLHTGEFLRNFPGGFSNFVEPSRRENGLKTGFVKYDEMTGGLRPGELTILAARPGVGKSAFAMNLAWHAATRFFTPVGVFSLEMSRESLLLRMLCSAAHVDSHRLRSGYLSAEERSRIRQAANQMAEAPIYIDDASTIGLMDLHAKVRRLEHTEKIKLGLVVVDYLQLMASHGKTENRSQEVSRVSRGLKLLSKDLGVPFLVLSQLSRASEQRNGDQRPRLTDLRESGSIEQDADTVAFLYREEMHRRDREDLRGLAELILGKQRSGPTGTINLIWLAAQQRFTSRAEDLGDVNENRDSAASA